MVNIDITRHGHVTGTHGTPLPYPIPSLQEFVSLAYSLETSVSIEIFIDFLGKREREGYTDCTSLFHGRIHRFHALFESSLTWKFPWNKLLFG